MSRLLVEFLENFYAQSLEEVGARLQSADYHETMQLLQLDQFADLYTEQSVTSAEPASSSARGPTPVFYRAGAGITQPFRRAGRQHPFFFARGWRGQQVELLSPESALHGCFGAPTLSDSKELKSLLLYSDEVAIIDPFAVRRRLSEVEWLALEQEFGSDYLNPSGMSAMRHSIQSVATAPLSQRHFDVSYTLQLLAAIAPLLRAGIVRVVSLPSRKAVYWGNEDAMRHEIAREVFVRGDGHPARFREAQLIALVLLERAKDQVLALASLGGNVCAFASGELDVVALRCVVDELIRLDTEMEGPTIPLGPTSEVERTASRWTARPSDAQRLTELARLQLPGVDSIRPRDMVTVRQRDVFVQFRGDVRRALASTMQESQMDVAAGLFAEEMQAASARMRAPRNRDALAVARGQAVSWVAGAIVGWSVANWSGAVAGVTARAALELSREHDRAKTALRNHYLAFS
jgi:hypothetical protein